VPRVVVLDFRFCLFDSSLALKKKMVRVKHVLWDLAACTLARTRLDPDIRFAFYAVVSLSFAYWRVCSWLACFVGSGWIRWRISEQRWRRIIHVEREDISLWNTHTHTHTPTCVYFYVYIFQYFEQASIAKWFNDRSVKGKFISTAGATECCRLIWSASMLKT
jgi:hypothetical protein